jgi:hypothetical protein
MTPKFNESDKLDTQTEDKINLPKSMLNTSLLVEVYKDRIAEIESSTLDEKQ